MCVWNFSENLWILRCACKKNGHCIGHNTEKELVAKRELIVMREWELIMVCAWYCVWMDIDAFLQTCRGT